MVTLRHTRYQAAIVHEGSILLLRCAWSDGRTAWMLPGGGRDEGEDESLCVAREVLEETALVVRVERLLVDLPADPPDGTYTRWRTYHCTVISGEAAPGGGEGGNAELVGVRWLSLQSIEWPDDVTSDPWIYPQLRTIRALLGIAP